jgi:hypothetical protein
VAQLPPSRQTAANNKVILRTSDWASMEHSFGSWAVSASETPGFATPPHDGCAVSGARQLRARFP